MVIVVNYYHSPAFEDALRKTYPELKVISLEGGDSGALARALPEATVLVGNTGNVDFHPFPQIKWIQSFSAGINHLIPRVPNHIIITRGLGVHDVAMSEHCLARMLAHEHKLLMAWDNQKKRCWKEYPTGRLAGKVLGIAGLGSIGQALAKRSQALDMKVLGLRSRSQPTPYTDAVYGPAQMDEFLGQLDYLAILLPLTDVTQGMFGKAQFAMMKEGSVLINMGRGAVVKEAELTSALEAETPKPSYALLDVFNEEPLPPESKLWGLPNVTITPHNAGGSQTEDCVELFMHNLEAFLASQPGSMRGVVERSRQY